MSKLLETKIIPAVNYHLWKACNYNCKFCFGTFNDVKKNNLEYEDAKQTVENIIDYGFEKITFSGGEPTLSKYLSDLIKIAKDGGLTTSIVTNGSMLSEQWLFNNKEYLDWIALSIDSLDLKTNIASGRFNTKNGFTKEKYLELIETVKDLGFKLKINTVVSQYNKNDDLNEFIRFVQPLRWKIFQALPIQIQNDEFKSEFEISQRDYKDFLDRHKNLEYIKESNYDMKGSYIMIDPLGRFFDNSNGIHKYSSKINEVGVESALSELNYSFKKFINRDGLYQWK